ncbi:hypothetical protein CORC01_14350 [Colletotrichum orchidophilum]|uniref:Uncharacterized protein n=1 Tax=Colletotrichum orchidophilum TaxID=1209926 RepID=A0A1G4AMF7_9PEZI|nr:uncharacterized protein CORC01_14350 [Colletotrichum orchidophilum]OHE90359.1 hypothetical protein CORC01_14350 [Colletotrichum orchidophilum]
MVDAFHLRLLRSPVPLRHHRRTGPPGRVRDGARAESALKSEEAYRLTPPPVGDVLSFPLSRSISFSAWYHFLFSMIQFF